MCRKKLNTDLDCPRLFDCHRIYIIVGNERETTNIDELIDLLEPIPCKETQPEQLELSGREKEELGVIAHQISMILFEYDPMCLNFGFNTDEYDHEAWAIAIKLKVISNPLDIVEIIYDVFLRSFSKDLSMYNRETKWVKMALRIWEGWTTHERI